MVVRKREAPGVRCRGRDCKAGLWRTRHVVEMLTLQADCSATPGRGHEYHPKQRVS